MTPTVSNLLKRSIILMATVASACVYLCAAPKSGLAFHKQQILEIMRSAPGVAVDSALLAASKDHKCGLGFQMFVRSNWNKLTGAQQRAIQSLQSPGQFEKHRLIGHFDIYYDTSNTNNRQPALLDSNLNFVPNSYEQYIDSVGYCFNLAWSIEVDSMDYPAPPIEQGESGYVVMVENLGGPDGGEYGETDPITQIGANAAPLYTTEIVVDRAYQGFYSPGIKGLKVTSAHEFQHSIQIGRYGLWQSDRYYYEICAVWMETVVHPEVPDYISYVEDPNGNPEGQFATPDSTFPLSNGWIEYGRVIWDKFIAKKFGPATMKATWEHIAQVRPLPAIDATLQTLGSSFVKAFVEWSKWNLNTGQNADTVQYYPQGDQYPPIQLKPDFYFEPPSGIFVDSLESISSVYHRVWVGGQSYYDIITNINTGLPDPGQQLYFAYDLSSSGKSGYKNLGNGVYVKLDVSDPQNWNSLASLPVNYAQPLVYPSPFLSAAGEPVNFVMTPAVSSIATLTVLSSSYTQIFRGDVQVVTLPTASKISWRPDAAAGNVLATGVYFFIIQIDNNQYKGKFAVVRK